jgi:hypothetical protein
MQGIYSGGASANSSGGETNIASGMILLLGFRASRSRATNRSIDRRRRIDACWISRGRDALFPSVRHLRLRLASRRRRLCWSSVRVHAGRSCWLTLGLGDGRMIVIRPRGCPGPSSCSPKSGDPQDFPDCACAFGLIFGGFATCRCCGRCSLRGSACLWRGGLAYLTVGCRTIGCARGSRGKRRSDCDRIMGGLSGECAGNIRGWDS